MAIGFGEFYLAGTVIAAALFILFVSKWINKIFRPRKQGRDLVFELDKSNGHYRDDILRAIREQGIKLEEKQLELRGEKIIISVEASIQVKKLKWLEQFLLENKYITAFSL